MNNSSWAVTIILDRVDKGARRFEERCLLDDGVAVVTHTELDFDFLPEWIESKTPARHVAKYLFYQEHYALMELRDARYGLLGYYCDIVDRMEKRDAHTYYLRDLFLDIWIPASGDPREIDRDEFERACTRGLLDETEREVAEHTVGRLLAEAHAGVFPQTVTSGYQAQLTSGDR